MARLVKRSQIIFLLNITKFRIDRIWTHCEGLQIHQSCTIISNQNIKKHYSHDIINRLSNRKTVKLHTIKNN